MRIERTPSNRKPRGADRAHAMKQYSNRFPPDANIEDRSD
jgi:hypothetical protein